MPTYEYLCKSCGERLEVQQAFTDDAMTECPRCEGPLRKIFGNVGITFKGKGFYKTDSRSSSTASTSPGSSSSGSSNGDGGSASSSGSSSSSSSGEKAASGASKGTGDS